MDVIFELSTAGFLLQQNDKVSANGIRNNFFIKHKFEIKDSQKAYQIGLESNISTIIIYYFNKSY